MRFRFTLATEKPCVLPLSYQFALQAWIYNRLMDSNKAYATQMHDKGHEFKQRNYKPFTFSNLRISNYKFNRDHQALKVHSDKVYFDVSAYDYRFSETFLQGIASEKITLADDILTGSFRIIKIEPLPDVRFYPTMRFRAMSPIVISYPEERNGKVMPQYVSPDYAGFNQLFAQNLINKYTGFLPENQREYMPFEIDEIEFRCLSRPKSKLIAFKTNQEHPIKVKGYLFNFELKAPSALMRCGYYAGFGEKTASGFGFANKM